jgi:hypothetical protein
VAQGQTVAAQLVLEGWAGGPRLDARRPRRAIHLEDTIEALQVDGDRGPISGRLHPAHHAGPAAERDRRGVRLLGPGEHPLELLLVGRMGHHVGWTVEASAEGAHHVAVGLPIGVRRALVRIGPTELGERGWRLQPRGRKLEILEPGRPLDVGRGEAEVLARRGGRGLDLLVRRLLVLEAPAPELAAAGHRGLRRRVTEA